MSVRAHIAFVIPTMKVGGTERQLIHLMGGLADEFEISLICTRSSGALIGEARRICSRVHILDARSGWDFRVGRRLFEFFRGHRPQIVHTFLFGFDYFAHRAAKRAGVPVIVSSRRELATWQRRRHRYMQRLGNRHVDCIVANSRAVAEYALRQEGTEPSLFRVIPNGIDARAFACPAPNPELRRRFALPSKGHIVGMVANVSPVKDHALFVNMAGMLIERGHDVHFFLIGNGPLLEHIGEMVIRRGLETHFHRFSTASEMAELYGAMDVSVLTSKMEGFPNALIESMAAGKPVVAPAVGGIKELIRDGETGKLVTSREPRAFAGAVGWFLENPEACRRVGSAAARWVRENLPLDALVRRHRDLYLELLERKRPRRV